jgi:hypothetical protein
MLPKWGTLLTYGSALVIKIFRSPSFGKLTPSGLATNATPSLTRAAFSVDNFNELDNSIDKNIKHSKTIGK